MSNAGRFERIRAIGTETVTAQWNAIDSAFADKVGEAGPDRKWLLVQTLATAGSRRALLSSLPIGPGWRVADIGCGFGATTLELAALGPEMVIGVDIDSPVLRLGAEIARGPVPWAGSVAFAEGNSYDLPFADGALDLVFSRFVFQHLADPGAAAAEIRRVLKPGGLVCAVDVDDGLSISEPSPSAAFERLAAALRTSQGSAGGDRFVGRRLPALLDRCGLAPGNVLVLPQAAYQVSRPGDPARALLLDRLRAARTGIVSSGAMTIEAFEADLIALETETPGPSFEVEAHLAVLATKRS